MSKHLVLFFTHDVCLKTWKNGGMFDREVRPYIELCKQGWDVSFVAYGDKSNLEFAESLAPIKILPAYDGVGKPPSRVWRVVTSPFVLWKHRKALKNADVYKSNQIWGAWNAILAKWVFGGAAIARCGYEYLAFSKAQDQAFHHQCIAWFADWFAYRFADRIVLATQDDKDFAFNHFGFLKDKAIDIQPNWVDTALFKPHKKPAKMGGDLVYIGRLNAQKNLPALIEAAKDANVMLDIYGDGELSGVLSIAAENNRKLRLMGRIANNDIPKMLAGYKAFILPSHFEGNPKVLLEAMACGMKVIATDVPGICGIVEDGRNGFLSNTDAQSLSAAIKRALKSKKDVGKAARAHIEKTYSFERFMKDEMKRLEYLS